eukprot:768051-Hanusia_phi.AAC.1
MALILFVLVLSAAAISQQEDKSDESMMARAQHKVTVERKAGSSEYFSVRRRFRKFSSLVRLVQKKYGPKLGMKAGATKARSLLSRSWEKLQELHRDYRQAAAGRLQRKASEARLQVVPWLRGRCSGTDNQAGCSVAVRPARKESEHAGSGVPVHGSQPACAAQSSEVSFERARVCFPLGVSGGDGGDSAGSGEKGQAGERCDEEEPHEGGRSQPGGDQKYPTPALQAREKSACDKRRYGVSSV